MRASFAVVMLSVVGLLFCVSPSRGAPATSALTASGTTSVGVIIVGSGPGRDCYLATETNPSKLSNSEALMICDAAVNDANASNRDRAAAYINRSFIELRMADYRGVLADSDRGIALLPQLGEAYLDRGAALIGLERYGEAIDTLDKGLEIGIEAQQLAYFDRGLAKEYLHDIRGAYYDYKKAVEIDPRFQLASDQLTRFTVTPVVSKP